MQFRSSHGDIAGSSAADDEDQAVGQQSRRAELAGVLKPGIIWNIPARGLNTACKYPPAKPGALRHCEPLKAAGRGR